MRAWTASLMRITARGRRVSFLAVEACMCSFLEPRRLTAATGFGFPGGERAVPDQAPNGRGASTGRWELALLSAVLMRPIISSSWLARPWRSEEHTSEL